MDAGQALRFWESLWAPYDQATYDFVLDQLEPDEVILDIGAGDLRLARQMAKRVRHVFAIENNPLLNQSNRLNLPANLTLIEGDAVELVFPQKITSGVLLMRHCTHFRLYADKLRQAGARRLFTNARWRLGVECVDLLTPRPSYEQLRSGWYACWCGQTGFKPGPDDDFAFVNLEVDHQISECPACGCQDSPKYPS